MPIPMTPAQKGYLAFRDVIDPFNLITILGSSALTIAIDSHTAYGPGFKGFGELSGVSFSQDVIGEFFGTFLIPSIAHEDPHYHRMPTATFPRRLLHAVSRTVIAQSDYGHPMPNYATLLTYPIASEISNLYVPGIQSNGPSTVKTHLHRLRPRPRQQHRHRVPPRRSQAHPRPHHLRPADPQPDRRQPDGIAVAQSPSAQT